MLLHSRGPVAAGALAVLLTLAAAAPSAADAAKTKGWSAATKAELKALEGKWDVLKTVQADREEDLTESGAVFTVKGAAATLRFGANSKSVRIDAIDPTGGPKRIDLIEVAPDKTERVIEGVYRIDGDKLQLAFSIPTDGKNRPTGFAKPTEPRVVVWTMKRVKE